MFSHKNAQQRRQRGFTLMEVVIVLAVIGALSAALAPMAFSYLADAKKTQAQNDANRIAEAIGKFLQDVALPPYKNNTSSTKSQVKQSGDFDCLYSLLGNDYTIATDATTGASWTTSAGVQCQAGSATRDTLENHLINNTPAGASANAYVTTGKIAWKGPYLPSLPADPWGNKYVVNIGKSDPGASKAVWVISAGSNGNIETAADASARSSIDPSGDDIIARVK
ncbi:MAG: type II secretion system protein GspG [Acidobacteriota bacterium]|nr:type II secretion system protein GspG [Acidobacteriota bacterium]